MADIVEVISDKAIRVIEVITQGKQGVSADVNKAYHYSNQSTAIEITAEDPDTQLINELVPDSHCPAGVYEMGVFIRWSFADLNDQINLTITSPELGIDFTWTKESKDISEVQSVYASVPIEYAGGVPTFELTANVTSATNDAYIIFSTLKWEQKTVAT